jgi:hypothetical protein
MTHKYSYKGLKILKICFIFYWVYPVSLFAQSGELTNDSKIGGLEIDTSSASKESQSAIRITRAVAHFERARSLIAAAIEEFNSGASIADPSAILNPQELRASLAKATSQLESVISPRPRKAVIGIKMKADPRLLGVKQGSK